MFLNKYKRLMMSIIVYIFAGGVVLGQVVLLDQVIKNGDRVKIKNVPLINQHPELPTGCEVTALAMLLQYSGNKVAKGDLAKQLPKLDLPYYKNGKRYGYHPSQGFIGNPYYSNSYGVYAPVITKMIEDYLPGRGENLTGESLEEILSNIDKGIPVMIWATIGMSEVSYTNEWIVSSKGTLFKWPGNEHAVVIVGYDKKYIVINDPYTGTEKKYLRTLVEKRFIELGRQAVAIYPKEIEEVADNGEVIADKEIEKSTVIQMTATLNHIPLKEEEGYNIIKKEERILIPLKYLPQLVEGIEVGYDTGVITISHGERGIKLQLDIEKNNLITTKPNAETVALYYEVEKGISRVDLEWFSQFFSIPYDMEDTTINIEIMGVQEEKDNLEDNEIKVNRGNEENHSIGTNDEVVDKLI